MLPKIHILFGAVFSLLLWLGFPQVTLLGALVVFLASVLIDIDHYLYYVYKTGKWSIKDSFNWFLKNKQLFSKMNNKEKQGIYSGLCFLHGIETLLILFILSLFHFTFSALFIFIAIGFLFHQTLDLIELHRKNYNYDKVVSFIYAVYNSKDKKLLQEL